MATRSIWKGTLGFGMVSIPVKLFGAVDDQKIGFKQLHKECKNAKFARVKMPRECSECGDKLEQEDIVRGYDLGDETYVVMEDSDFAGLPVKSLKAIDVVEFVDADEIDPRHYDTPYFVAPDKAGGKAFALMLAAMSEVGKVAVAKLTMRERERVCTVRPFGDVLMLQTLYRTDELRDASSVQVDLPAVSDQEKEMAVGLIEAMEADVDLSKFPDTYREALLERIEAKLNGTAFPTAAPEEEEPTEDVLVGLAASIQAVKDRKAA